MPLGFSFFRSRKTNLIPGYFNPNRLREDQIRRSEKLKVKLHGDGTVSLTHKDPQQFEADGTEMMSWAVANDMITLWNISDYDLRHIEVEILKLPEKTEHVMSFGITSHREINTMMAQIGWFVECLGYNSRGLLYDGSKEMSGQQSPEWHVGDILRVGIHGHAVYFVHNNKMIYYKNHAADDITLRHRVISMAMFPGTAVKVTSLGSKDETQDPWKIKGLQISSNREEWIIQSGETGEEEIKNERAIRQMTPGDEWELDQRPKRLKHALIVVGIYFLFFLVQISAYKNNGVGLWAIFRPWSRWWLSSWT